MKIAFLTTQSVQGSTVVGRVLPLAQELTPGHEVHVVVHADNAANSDTIKLHFAGRNPFLQTSTGKKRLKGIVLGARIVWNAWLQASELFRIKPDVVVIVKSLPQSVLAAFFARYIFLPKASYILDVDDFELTANTLSSWFERAAVHWAQRTGAKFASTIVVASPFLQDYFQQLAPTKKIVLIPTGITAGLPAEALAKEGPALNQTRLLYLGSVSIASGHRVDLLPDILEQVRKAVPDAQLTIAGSGDDIESLKQTFAAKNLDSAVTWHGRYTSDDIPTLLATASIIIDPIDGSVTNRAKSSSRVLTALAVGKPIVTSNIGIRSQMIPQQFHSRFFATPADASDYAARSIALLQQPLSEAEQSALKGNAMRYTWSVLAQEYLKLLL